MEENVKTGRKEVRVWCAFRVFFLFEGVFKLAVDEEHQDWKERAWRNGGKSKSSCWPSFVKIHSQLEVWISMNFVFPGNLSVLQCWKIPYCRRDSLLCFSLWVLQLGSINLLLQTKHHEFHQRRKSFCGVCQIESLDMVFILEPDCLAVRPGS